MNRTGDDGSASASFTQMMQERCDLVDRLLQGRCRANAAVEVPGNCDEKVRRVPEHRIVELWYRGYGPVLRHVGRLVRSGHLDRRPRRVD